MYPIGSMGLVCLPYIYHEFTKHVGKHTLHGSFFWVCIFLIEISVFPWEFSCRWSLHLGSRNLVGFPYFLCPGYHSSPLGFLMLFCFPSCKKGEIFHPQRRSNWFTHIINIHLAKTSGICQKMNQSSDRRWPKRRLHNFCGGWCLFWIMTFIFEGQPPKTRVMWVPGILMRGCKRITWRVLEDVCCGSLVPWKLIWSAASTLTAHLLIFHAGT